MPKQRVPIPIYFHSEYSNFSLPNAKDITQWVSAAAEEEKVTISGLNYIFCSDEFLLDINVKYLNHRFLTDVITFPYQEGKIIESDIFISIDRVKENAEQFQTEWFDELCRVIIHGFLHLCGYNDKSDDECSLMRNKEDYYLTLRSF